ncbi:MAG: hypothetical protein ABII18_13825 [bacterium]
MIHTSSLQLLHGAPITALTIANTPLLPQAQGTAASNFNLMSASKALLNSAHQRGQAFAARVHETLSPASKLLERGKIALLTASPLVLAGANCNSERPNTIDALAIGSLVALGAGIALRNHSIKAGIQKTQEKQACQVFGMDFAGLQDPNTRHQPETKLTYEIYVKAASIVCSLLSQSAAERSDAIDVLFSQWQTQTQANSTQTSEDIFVSIRAFALYGLARMSPESFSQDQYMKMRYALQNDAKPAQFKIIELAIAHLE